MSTTLINTSDSETLRSPTTSAGDILNALWKNGELCNWCFGRKRRYWSEYEESLAKHLQGRNTATLEARGHRVQEDGTLLVDSTATSEADPSTFYDVVPPTTIDGKHYPARAMSVCSCGCVDYDSDDNRTTRELKNAARNIHDRLTDETDISIHKEAMLVYIESAMNNRMGGQDAEVLKGCIRFGRKKAAVEPDT